MSIEAGDDIDSFWSNWSLFNLEVCFFFAGLVEIWSILHKLFLDFSMCSDGGKAAWLWACTEKLHTSPKRKCRLSLVDNPKPKLSSRKNTAFGRTALILASPSSPLFFWSCWSSLECKVEGIAKII